MKSKPTMLQCRNGTGQRISATDILQVRADQNYLVDYFTHMECLREEPVVLESLSRVAKEIGFDRVRPYVQENDIRHKHIAGDKKRLVVQLSARRYLIYFGVFFQIMSCTCSPAQGKGIFDGAYSVVFCRNTVCFIMAPFSSHRKG